ncbi:major facilitator superfamily domain-containing protein [Mycena galericulata]|nr:major facilitator superfamily domain-containing protein [Mycena galericulata]
MSSIPEDLSLKDNNVPKNSLGLWSFFWVGWLAWMCDALYFISVGLSVPALGTQFNKDTTDITQAITLTLLFRTVGAVIFGLFSDRFGRKWPLVLNLLFVAVLELGAGFVQTFRQFLVLRSLFGIGMGGIWGMAASTSLENLPVGLRGIGSGVLQQGYTVGYLIAAVISLELVPEVSQGWRSLFWVASGISLFVAILRLLLPESTPFLRACFPSAAPVTGGFTFLSHGSQDLYPTYLQKTKGFTAHSATIATIIGAFCVQFGVQAAWGVIPIHLTEMAPPAFRASFPGVVYQLGNMVSSASAQIEATGGNHFKTTVNGVVVPDSAKVQGILIGVVAAFLIVVTLIGPENHSSQFEKHRAAFDENGGADEAWIVDDVDGEDKTSEKQPSLDNEKAGV